MSRLKSRTGRENLMLMERIRQLEEELKAQEVREVIREVPVEKEVIREVVKEVPVEVIKEIEIIKEVPVPVVKQDDGRIEELEQKLKYERQKREMEKREYRHSLSVEKASILREFMEDFDQVKKEHEEEIEAIKQRIKDAEEQDKLSQSFAEKELQNERERSENLYGTLEIAEEELKQVQQAIAEKERLLKDKEAKEAELLDLIKKKDEEIEEMRAELEYDAEIKAIQKKLAETPHVKWERLSAGRPSTAGRIPPKKPRRKPTPFRH